MPPSFSEALWPEAITAFAPLLPVGALFIDEPELDEFTADVEIDDCASAIFESSDLSI